MTSQPAGVYRSDYPIPTPHDFKMAIGIDFITLFDNFERYLTKLSSETEKAAIDYAKELEKRFARHEPYNKMATKEEVALGERFRLLRQMQRYVALRFYNVNCKMMIPGLTPLREQQEVVLKYQIQNNRIKPIEDIHLFLKFDLTQ
jgi:hypothetical protein